MPSASPAILVGARIRSCAAPGRFWGRRLAFRCAGFANGLLLRCSRYVGKARRRAKQRSPKASGGEGEPVRGGIAHADRIGERGLAAVPRREEMRRTIGSFEAIVGDSAATTESRIGDLRWVFTPAPLVR